MSNLLVHSCPGSVAAQHGLPADPTSVHMQRGTDVHTALALYALTGTVDAADAAGLDDAGAQALAECRKGIDTLVEQYPGHRMLVEHGVDASARIGLGEGAYKGTLDLGLISPDGEHLVLVDHKSGMRPVSADSKQLAGYLIGLRTQYPQAKRFTAIVNQPGQPINPVERDLAAMDEVEQQISATVREALSDTPRRIAGAHCQNCRAISQCTQARVFVQHQLIDAQAHEPHQMTGQMLADLLNAKPAIEALLDAARLAAIDRISTDSDAVPGFVVGRSRAPRRWRDDAQAREALADLVPADALNRIAIASPAQVIAACPELQAQIEHLLTPPTSASRLLPARDALPAAQRSAEAISRLLSGVQAADIPA